MTKQHRWLNSEVERLKTLWGEGKTATVIAEAIGGGVTKNSVIGMSHRLQLPRRPVGRPRTSDGSKGRYDNTRQRRFVAIKPHGARVHLKPDHPASRDGHALFQARVIHASVVERVLKSGHNSRKTGSMIEKGRWKGMPIYTLTLEERRTCPRSCLEWATCYGNNMNWAQRIIADDVFEARLVAELDALQAEHPGGFVVRLHILGDFYSTDYVQLWADALDRLPALNVFGYTARLVGDPIGAALFQLSAGRWERFAIRFSGSGFATLCSEVVDTAEEASGIVCPAQSNETMSCATCTLCWSTPRTITFLRH